MNNILEPINPAKVPSVTLANGANIPAIGLGTFGSDHHSPTQVAAAVKEAIQLGYRLIDCASVYGNEKEIGAVFEELFRSNIIQRKDLTVTSKAWNNQHGDIIGACKQSLADLHLDYLDLYLVHWPFPNHHAQGVCVDSRDPHAVPYIHEQYMKTWSAMEQLVQMGLVRNIGTSNMSIPKMKLLLRDCHIKPAVNEMELHPHFQQRELFEFLRTNSIQPIGFCPIGSPGRPERDKTPEDTSPIQDPILIEIAQHHHVHPAVICIKWAVQNGQIPIPFSVKPANLRMNLLSVTKDPLTPEEMQHIRGIDKNCRLIKGQVFLWPTAKDWHDLWDENGIIAK